MTENLVTLDRRSKERREKPEAVAENRPAVERRVKTQRRRQIDPTTCERDYSDDECEFMQAIEAYKRKSGRMFPTCSEVLEVVRSLGYVKVKIDKVVVATEAIEVLDGSDAK